jgi:hypothetical protein
VSKKKHTVSDPYFEKYAERVAKHGKEYSGNTTTDTHLDLIREMGGHIDPALLDRFNLPEEVQDEIWDGINAALGDVKETLIEEAYKLGFYFAQHEMMKHLSRTEHDDF